MNHQKMIPLAASGEDQQAAVVPRKMQSDLQMFLKDQEEQWLTQSRDARNINNQQWAGKAAATATHYPEKIPPVPNNKYKYGSYLKSDLSSFQKWKQDIKKQHKNESAS